MSDVSSLQILRRYSPHFRFLAFAISSISLLFLAIMIYIGGQRPAEPEFFSVFYVGILLGAVQIPLSVYMWRYIPARMPVIRDEQILVRGFRMTMLVGLLLCAGIVKFAGIAAILTGYAYPSAILGGLALGAMVYHLPGDRTFELFIKGISEQ